MLKIMFVCHGNICRSPMAEFIFKDLVAKEGLSAEFEIASSATSTEELGNPVYPPAAAELARHGLKCAGKYSVQLKKSDYEKYDWLLMMDSHNIRNAKRIIGQDPQQKVRRLLEFAGRNEDVADPWYTDRFDIAYADISEGCQAFLDYLRSASSF
ncbi:MAG: low molecular weight phosphotyrosine protein phosphatase [Thermoguttaceae bacterium]|nr:low molecular weight phosphotyrosine protein phosphatase [Thermoguttaceae bacterium]